MDSFTQIVLGAAVSNAVLGKKMGNRSLLYGAVIGTIPDLDIIAGKFLSDPLSAIEIHRGFSHSIVFFILLSLLLAKAIQFAEKRVKISYRRVFTAVFLILFTHSLLDIFTTWGTQIFWPWKEKIALKSIFVIDPLYTLPLLFFLYLSARLPKYSRKRYRRNTAGLILSTSYLLVTLVLQAVVSSKAADQLKNEKTAYIKIQAKPAAFTAVLWNIIAEDDDFFYLSDYSFLDTQPIQFKKYPKKKVLIKDIEKDASVQRLIRISENQYTITQDSAGVLYFNDLRFGLLKDDPDDIQFAFSYKIIKKQTGVEIHEVAKKRRDGVQLIKKIISRIKGN